MDIRQLHALVAVVDHGSFSAAAEALFTVQSNVSSHVAKLERELGTPLLDRRTRTPTAAGEIVLRHARTIAENLDAIADELAALEHRVIGDVAFGTTPSIGLWVIPPSITRLTTDHPDVTLQVFEAQSDELVQRVAQGDLDLAMTTGRPMSALDHVHLFDEDILAVVANDDRLANRDRLSFDDLADREILLPLPDNPLHTHIVEAMSAQGSEHAGTQEIGSSALVAAMAAAGLGVALVPASATVQDDATRRLPVDGLPPRAVELIGRLEPPPSRVIGAVGELLADVARAAAETRPGCRAHWPEPRDERETAQPRPSW